MAALSRRESESRQQAVLNFFMTNLGATGDEAQKALLSGKLTGKADAKMGIAMLFKIKRQAEKLVSGGKAQTGLSVVPTEKAGPMLAELRELVSKMQHALAAIPDVTEVHITRSSAKIVRTVAREEAL